MNLKDIFTKKPKPVEVEEKGITVPVAGGTNSRYGALFISDRMPGADKDYAALAGDPWLNGVVRAATDWIAGNYSQCRPMVQALNAEGEWEDVPNHALETLLRRPSPHYGGRSLRRMIAQSLLTTGNCYLLIDRNGAGRAAGLTWIPSEFLQIEWSEDPDQPILRYWYTPRGRKIPYDPKEIVHLRFGADPHFAGLMGVAPVQAVLRELAADNQLSTRYAALLRNGGAIPYAVTPSGQALSPEEQEQLAEDFNNNFTGERVGRFAVFSSPLTFTALSYSPDQLAAHEIRADIIRRIAASMGVPVAVLGLAPDGTTFNNVKEMTRNVWETRTLSDLALLSEELAAKMLPEFERHPENFRVTWDTSEVAALREDEDAAYRRADLGFRSGFLSLNESREMVGKPPLEDPEFDLPRGVPEDTTGSTVNDAERASSAQVGAPGGKDGPSDNEDA